MKGLFFVLSLCMLQNLFAGNIVPVPTDYSANEIPIGSTVKIKKELVLTGSSTKTDVLETKSSSDGHTIFVTCKLEYLPSPKRRILPADLILSINSVSERESSTAPGHCWKDGNDKTGKLAVFAVRSKSGFAADLICYEQTVWRSPQEICRYNDLPSVGQMNSQLSFFADEDKLKSIISD